MSSSFDQYQKRKLISSYFSVILSITLVLLMLGALGLLVLNANKVANHFKEKVVLTIFLKDSAKDIEIKQLEKSLVMADYVKSTEYVSKEQAAEFMKAQNGEDFMDFIGYNPLQNSIDVNVLAEYVTSDKLEEISKTALNKNFVDDVAYDEDLVSLMNDNVRKISFIILLISGVLAIIAVLLINSSIRLAVYSKRFTIKTMQMVGATKHFIRRPFIWKSVRLGMIGAVLAIILLSIGLYSLDKIFTELGLLTNTVSNGLLFSGVFILGVLITWVSTFIATQRFLNLKTEQLY